MVSSTPATNMSLKYGILVFLSMKILTKNESTVTPNITNHIVGEENGKPVNIPASIMTLIELAKTTNGATAIASLLSGLIFNRSITLKTIYERTTRTKP